MAKRLARSRSRRNVFPINARFGNSIHRAGAGTVTIESFAERCTETVEDGSTHQATLKLRRLPPENLFEQVLLDGAGPSAKGAEIALAIRLVTQRQADQTQADDPSLELGMQMVQGLIRDLDAGNLLDSGAGLLQIEAEVFLPDLDDIAAGAHSAERKGWIVSRDQNQVQEAGGMLQETVDNVVDGLVVDAMVVVEHQNDRLAERLQVHVQIAGEDRRRGQVVCFEYLLGAPAGPFVDRSDRSDQIAEEPPRIVVLLIQRQPRDTYLGCVEPARHERALAVPGRR